MHLARTHATWVLGFADEVWWSRVAQPEQHRWSTDGDIIRLQERERLKDDATPKALACYGLLVRDGPPPAEQMLLRFVEGRPVSAVTIDLLAWSSERLAEQGMTALFLIWDNASWHKSQAVRTWLRWHNQRVKATGHGVRLIAFRLPVKSPWLNPIEPKWVHGKRAVAEADRMLSAEELETRVYAYYRCDREDHLGMPKKVA
jgi:DDE superfamily endonuclease